MQVVKNGTALLPQILEKVKAGQATENIAENVLLMEQVLRNHFKTQEYTLSYHAEARKALNILTGKTKE